MNKVLIVKIGAIGDVVMSMSMLPALKESSVTWICGKIVAPLLQETHLIDKLIEVDEQRLLTGSIWQKLRELFSVWRKLLFHRYDLMIIAHPDPRYQMITKFVRAKEKRVWVKGGAYHGMEYLRLVGGVEVRYPEIDPKTKFSFGSNYVVIAPGGAKNALAESPHRRWPIENYAKVIEELAKITKVIVTGAASDEWVRSYLPKDSYVDLIGRAELLDLVAILKRCKLLITHDSGPLHLGKLAKCPTIALFGPTNPSEFAERLTVLWGGENLPCRPCYDGKRFAKCADHLCMKSISPELVIQTALNCL